MNDNEFILKILTICDEYENTDMMEKEGAKCMAKIYIEYQKYMEELK